MSSSVDVDLILHTIDEASKEWKQKFQTTSNELIEAIQDLFSHCIQVLIQLSNSKGNDDEQIKQDHLNAERIVSKLKELRVSLGNIWPLNMDSFARDIFNIGSYHIEAAEFFHPVPYYPGDNLLMKLYRWSVYDPNRTVIIRYYLEKSELIPGQPYYVLGKALPNSHSQIQPYGSIVPEYNQMKNHVIADLNGQGPSPIISSTIA